MSRRIIFVIILLSYITSQSYAVIPTKGEIWPEPQYEQKTGIYYTVRSSEMTVNVSQNSCDLLTEALKRYMLTLRNLEQYQKLYGGINKHEEENEDVSLEYLKGLRIELSSTCEHNPHFDMDEWYTLVVESHSVLRSDSIWGILRGLESFVQLFYFSDDFSEVRIDGTTIVDYPQYKHRGLLIDTSRHYVSVSNILKIVDGLAMNKMNVLHWHIIDDQSFPYQSEIFPSLSEKGAYFPSMVYTKENILSVVAFARDRGVRVIPEIDVPGHTLSWGKAYPNLLTQCYKLGEVVGMGPLNPTKNETYDFLEKLYQEVHQWFPDEFLHIGGDEVQVACWDSNPFIRKYLEENNIAVNQLQGHFLTKMLPRLPQKTKPIVWQEAFDMNALPDQKTQVQVWWYDWAKEMDKILNAGHDVIFSSTWYLDYKNPTWEQFYRSDPRQIVYKYRQSSEGLLDIVGGEACMWGEQADDTNILTKVWPRTSSVAERLWSGLPYASSEDPVNDVVRSRIEEHVCRMNRRGVPAQPANGPGFCVLVPPHTPSWNGN